MRAHTVPVIIARQRRPPRLVPRRAPVPPTRFVPHAHQYAPITGGASAPVGAPALILSNSLFDLPRSIPSFFPLERSSSRDVGTTIGGGLSRARYAPRS